ncbi:MAG: helix-turn-helix domain-containing protein [Vicinamibacteria bacterium]|nr:helix-turn-helix domain-containing protein [Vicinamibacteria bacterium]
MKNKTYYEILGVASHVGSGQIQAAYRFARSLYSGEATPTYGLLTADERDQMLALVEEAYAALSNPNVRRDYDIHLAAQGVRSHAQESAPPHPEPVPPERTRAARVPPAPDLSAAEPPSEPARVPEQVNGSVLKALRESRHLTIDQIAALSKVGSRFLKALEDDRHDALPGRVFARGFLIEYARALRVSDTELVERYLKHWTGK